MSISIKNARAENREGKAEYEKKEKQKLEKEGVEKKKGKMSGRK